MTQQIAYLEAVVGADITSFRRGMQEVRRETGLLSDTMGGISHLGRNMTLAITTPLLAAAGASVKLAGSFDASMRNINSIAFLSEDALAKLSQRTLEFGSSIRSGPQAASEALYTVFSAGITDVEQAFMVMQVGAKTAEAGLADLTTTTEGLTAAALTFGDQSEAALMQFSDATTLAVQLGVGSMDTFNTGIANVMGTGAAVGDTFTDLSATIAYLSQRGIDFASAGTYLNNALTKMLKPGEDLDALFTRMGTKSGKELIETSGGFVNALREMYKVVGGDETIWAKLFPDARGFKAVSRIFTMFEEDGTDAVSTFFDTFNQKMEEGGITSAAWEQQMMSFSAQFDMLTSALQGFGITIGNILLPVITPIVNKITEFITGLSQAEPEVLQLGVAFAALVAAAGPVLWLFGSLITPFGILIGLVGSLAVAFATDFGGIRTTVENFVTDVLGPLDDVKNGIQIFLDTLFGNGEDTKPTMPSFVLPPAKDIIQINPQDSAISLWDFYSGEGAIEKFSWTEFQQMAKDAGWDGGAIKPGDILNLIVPSGGLEPATMDKWLADLIPGKDDMMKAWNDFDRANMGGGGDDSFGGKIAKAFETAWPTIQTALDSMWSNFKTWVDETAIPAIDDKAGDIIGAVAGWFLPTGSTGKGDSPVYNALKDLLSGDIGKTAENIGTWFNDHFPEVSTKLSTFAENIGNWFINEGVPTVARSIGYMGGKLVSVFNQAMSSLFSFVTGQGANGGPTAGNAAKGFQDHVLTPVSEGFNQALADSGIQSGSADSFFTNLEGMLLAGAAAWVIAPKFATDIIGKIAGAIKTGLTGETAKSAFNGLWSGITSLLSGALPKGGILDDIALRGMFAVDKIKDGLSGAIASAAGSLGTLSIVGLAVAATVGALVMIFDENARRQVNEAVGSLIDGAFGENTYGNLNKSFEQGVYRTLGEAMITVAQFQINPEAKAAMEAKGQEFINMAGNPTIPPEWGDDTAKKLHDQQAAMFEKYGFDFTDIGQWFGGSFDPAKNTEFNVNAGGTASMFKNPIVDSINQTTVTPEDLAPFTATMETGINGALASGNYDGQAIVDTLIVPLATGFTTNFGAESAAAIAWTTFITGVTTGEATVTEKFTLMSEDALLLATDMETNMPRVSAAVVSAMNPIIKSLHDADFAAKNLSATLSGLDGQTVTFTTQVVGGGVPVDHNASGGTIFGGMSVVGERGPELIDMGANKGSVMPTRILKNAIAGMGQNTGTTVINVYGVTTVDDFLFEMERRGYPVNR